jgi:hypothetical protein
VEKAANLANAMQPGWGGFVQQYSGMKGALISNPTLSGVDQTKDWYVAAFFRGTEEPQVVFAVPGCSQRPPGAREMAGR